MSMNGRPFISRNYFSVSKKEIKRGQLYPLKYDLLLIF